MTSRPKAWRWAIGWSIAVLALSCAPYFVAILTTPEGWHFAGFLVNPLDGHSYLAKMQQGEAGKWLFHLTYTPEPHAGSFIFTFYLALGHLAALTGLPKILIFHLARLLAGFGLLLTVFRFISRITPHLAEQRLAFVLVFSASGLGWLGVIFDAFPIDLWVPEAFVPYSLYANPHFPLAMMLMLLIFEQMLLNPKSKIQNLKSGLAALTLALILPFALLTVWAVLAVFLGWRYVITRRLPWVQIWPTLSAGLFSAPVIGYQYWVSTTNPILAGWGAQNVTAAPTLLDFGLGYGLVGLLALLGIGLVVKKTITSQDTPLDLDRSPKYNTFQISPPDPPKGGEMSKIPPSGGLGRPNEWLIVIWGVITVALVYFPFDLQRRLITGLHVPLCILAAIGLSRWLAHSSLKANYQQLIRMMVVTLGVLGTLIVWSLPLIGTLQPPEESVTSALFFIRDEEMAAFEWLQANTQANDVILASPRVGLFVPGQTGARAFYGHPFETIEAKDRESQSEAFYRGDIKTVSPPVQYIIYGPSEQALGQPEVLGEYPIVFSAGELMIFRVTE